MLKTPQMASAIICFASTVPGQFDEVIRIISARLVSLSQGTIYTSTARSPILTRRTSKHCLALWKRCCLRSERIGCMKESD